MIAENTIKTTLKAGGNVIGTFVKLSDPSAVEIFGLLGYDFFILDNEHGTVGKESMVNILRAADSTGIMPIIRVREKRPIEILQALDAGAMGVLVPHVNSKADVVTVVESAKYDPVGKRGYATVTRAANYGLQEPFEYFPLANQKILVACYCETIEAVRNLDDMLTVEDLDVVFIGPMDLSQTMGITAQMDHPDLLKTIDKVLHKVKAAGKAPGIIAPNAEAAKRLNQKGYQFVTISCDQSLLANAARQIIQEYRT